MINRIISEISAALSNKLYLSALTLALTLPDTCGKAEEPEKSTGTRYRNWCNKYVFNRESELFKEIVEEERVENYVIGNDMPYLDAEIIYKLRNSLLHQSTPNSECESKLDKFVLVVSKEECADGDVSVVEYDGDRNIKHRELKIYVTRLCNTLCSAAKDYYESNKEKFDFIKYSIIDNETGENFVL